jgi:hypothetical protein
VVGWGFEKLFLCLQKSNFVMKKILLVVAVLLAACNNDYGPERLETAQNLINNKAPQQECINALQTAKHYKSVEKKADSLLQIIYAQMHIDDSIKIVADSIENEKAKKLKDELMSHFSIQKDEMGEQEWYLPKNTGTLSYNNNNIFTYISKAKKGGYGLWLAIHYNSEGGLFIKDVDFKVDTSDVVNLGSEYGRYKTDSYKTIWEWKDYDADEKIFTLIAKIANCKVCKIKLNGTNYSQSEELSPLQIKDFGYTIKLYATFLKTK